MLSLAKFVTPRPEPLSLAFFHFRHGWFFAVFLFCTAIVLANVVHYILFRVLRRREAESKERIDWGLQRYLSHPSRAIFFLTCFLLVLPTIPGLPYSIET